MEVNSIKRHISFKLARRNFKTGVSLCTQALVKRCFFYELFLPKKEKAVFHCHIRFSVVSFNSLEDKRENFLK